MNSPYQQTPITEDILQTHIAYLDLPLRLNNILERNGVRTIQDLLYCCPKDHACKKCPQRIGCELVRLLAMKGINTIQLQVIYNAFEERGLFVRKTEKKG